METFLLWLGVIAFVAATVYFILLGTRTQSGRIFHIITAVITGTAALS